MSPVIFRDDPVFSNLRGNIKDVGNVMLQKQIKDQDEKKAVQQMLQKLVLETSLKNKQFKPGADLSSLDTSNGMGGILGQINPMLEQDPMTQLETTGKIADIENKIYAAGGPAPSRTPKTVLGGGQSIVSDSFPGVPGISPKEADELKMVTEKAKIAETYRPASQAEETNALYTKRTEQAEKVFTKLEDELSHLGLGASIMQAKGPFGIGVPNAFKTSDAQSYEQAKRNFLNSVLRKESGAVISPTEFTEGNQQYFPQPGDKADVIAQKKENRRIAIEGLKQSSGKAYSQSGGMFTGRSNGIDLKSKYGLE